MNSTYNPRRDCLKVSPTFANPKFIVLSFTLTNVQFANDGLYSVVATDTLRSVTSEPAAPRVSTG